jgi:hypothetical protein
MLYFAWKRQSPDWRFSFGGSGFSLRFSRRYAHYGHRRTSFFSPGDQDLENAALEFLFISNINPAESTLARNQYVLILNDLQKLKFFRINSYKKPGEGGPIITRTPTSPLP